MPATSTNAKKSIASEFGNKAAQAAAKSAAKSKAPASAEVKSAAAKAKAIDTSRPKGYKSKASDVEKLSKRDLRAEDAKKRIGLTIACPSPACGAAKGAPCVERGKGDKPDHIRCAHGRRVKAAEAAAAK